MPEKPPENLENIKEPKTPEQELSPEVLEKAMAKVQDINEHGTAYTVIDKYREYQDDKPILEKIFEEGLLSTIGNIPNKESWARFARIREGVVYFNIINEVQKESFIKNSYWVNNSNSEKTIIMFDLKPFKKVEKSGLKKKNRSYQIGSNPYEDKIISTEDGYELSFRVAPRYFCGLIFKPQGKSNRDVVGTDEGKLLQKELLTQMKDGLKDKNESFIPIYDIHGNLWWPKQMSYKEVKKFVDERDKNKKEER